MDDPVAHLADFNRRNLPFLVRVNHARNAAHLIRSSPQVKHRTENYQLLCNRLLLNFLIFMQHGGASG
jgi:hypothetical protein